MEITEESVRLTKKYINKKLIEEIDEASLREDFNKAAKIVEWVKSII
jgi:hypothetical protein